MEIPVQSVLVAVLLVANVGLRGPQSHHEIQASAAARALLAEWRVRQGMGQWDIVGWLSITSERIGFALPPGEQAHSWEIPLTDVRDVRSRLGRGIWIRLEKSAGGKSIGNPRPETVPSRELLAALQRAVREAKSRK